MWKTKLTQFVNQSDKISLNTQVYFVKVDGLEEFDFVVSYQKLIRQESRILF